MKQKWMDPETGRMILVGDREDIAEALGEPRVWGLTFAKYSRMGWPKSNPAPRPVSVDRRTRRDLFVLAECLEWDRRRLGPGRTVQVR